MFLKVKFPRSLVRVSAKKRLFPKERRLILILGMGLLSSPVTFPSMRLSFSALNAGFGLDFKMLSQ
ncbi:hypothetical protein FQZ97_739940 [compost metagenome]